MAFLSARLLGYVLFAILLVGGPLLWLRHPRGQRSWPILLASLVLTYLWRLFCLLPGAKIRHPEVPIHSTVMAFCLILGALSLFRFSHSGQTEP
ncbi:MAG: hypothetical protein U0931_11105 [Vulcanimicrobiota bacterium]